MTVRYAQGCVNSVADTNEIPIGFTKPTGIPADYAELARLMFDLTTMDFRRTRPEFRRLCWRAKGVCVRIPRSVRLLSGEDEEYSGSRCPVAIVYEAPLADPNRHDHDHCPTLLSRNAGGRIRTDNHIEVKPATPISDLHLALLDTVGVPRGKLGNSDGKLNFLADFS